MLLLPEPQPEEFRDDVVAVARKGEAPIAEVAKAFGISESRLRNWLAKAEVVEGRRPVLTSTEAGELRELKRVTSCQSRKTRCCAEPRRTCTGPTCERSMYVSSEGSALAVDGLPVTVTRWVRSTPARPRRVDKPSRVGRGQRDDGVLLRSAA